jgi:hypothetical protein
MLPFAQVRQGLYQDGVAENVRVDFSLLQVDLDVSVRPIPFLLRGLLASRLQRKLG